MTKTVTSLTLPSRFAIGDTVVIPCIVRAVHFSDAKVNYIVDVGGYLLSVDSCDTYKPEGEQAAAQPAQIVQVI